MAWLSTHHVNVAGLSGAVPKQAESNWDLPHFSEAEKKLFIKTTGVETRRVAPKGLTTSDLCFEATEALLNKLQWEKEEVEVLIFLSQSRDYYLPSTSTILQDRLKLSEGCITFDIGLGCSGFVYGLSVISSLMQSGQLKKGLLMVGDVSSATCASTDKSTYPLFGDAGCVCALEYTPTAPPMHFQLNSDGSGYEAIMIPDGGIRNLVSEESFRIRELDKGISRSRLHVALNGLDVFSFSVGKVPKSMQAFLDKHGFTPADFDYLLMHQANLLMNETIRKKMKFSPEQVPYSIRDYGNTSSASIPLTMLTELKEALSTKKCHALLSGFGVGLSWGVMSLSTNKVVCTEVLEI